MSFTPRPLEIGINWRARDVIDPSTWTMEVTAADRAELDAALKVARASGKKLVDITREEFPLDAFVEKVARIETELLDGRGFVLLRKLDAGKYSRDELELMFWGIGMHLGSPWPQNRYGELITDVTDRGTNEWNADQREDERGGIAFDYHTDGADLVGLLCLATAQSGGKSCLANTIGIYNDLCAARPDLLQALHEEIPVDFRGEHPVGGNPFFTCPVFTVFGGRLFVRFILEYIQTSQRHPEAPRLTPLTIEAIETLSAMASKRRYNVYMAFQPGDIQFINNHHVLHGRTAYVDAPEFGLKRHIKRLWLGSHRITKRPRKFMRRATEYWEQKPAARQHHGI